MTNKNSFLDLSKSVAQLQVNLASFIPQLLNHAFGRKPTPFPFREDQFIPGKGEACKLLNASESTLRRWEKAGIIKPIRWAGICIYSIRDLFEIMSKDPKIQKFLTQKLQEQALGITRNRKRVPRLTYTCRTLPKKDYIFLEIRYRGEKLISWASKDFLKNDSLLHTYICDIVNCYFQFNHNSKNPTNVN